MSTDNMYGNEEANPPLLHAGYGEATPSDASKLGYEWLSDHRKDI